MQILKYMTVMVCVMIAGLLCWKGRDAWDCFLVAGVLIALIG